MTRKLTGLVPPRQPMNGDLPQGERIRSAGWNACREAMMRNLRRMKARKRP